MTMILSKFRYAWSIGLAMTLVLSSGCQDVARIVGLEDTIQASSSIQAEEGPLLASGTIQATEVRIASELGGRIAEVRVRPGDKVRAGDVLATLDSTPLLTELAKAEAAVASAEGDLAVVQAGPRVEQIAAAQGALALARSQRDGVLAAWENAQAAVENPQELDEQIVEARTKVELAVQNVELAEAQLALEQLLRDQKPEDSVGRQIADLQVRAAESTLAAAQADQNTAQTLLNWLRAIRSQPLGLIAKAHAAEGQYHVAEVGVTVAQARLDDLLDGPTSEEVAVAEAAVHLAQAKAAVLESQHTRFSLASPIDGVVLSQVLYAGEVAAPAATILTVANLQALTLEVYVPASRIGEVYLGQNVEVTVDGFPGKTFAGQVMHVADEPEFTPRNVATQEERLNTFFTVEIELTNEDGLLKPGMPADVNLDA
ncbi:MAG TPA: efflux RND transporter periplasmic adaptor subunit [Anaerolineae bacterium]